MITAEAPALTTTTQWWPTLHLKKGRKQVAAVFIEEAAHLLNP